MYYVIVSIDCISLCTHKLIFIVVSAELVKWLARMTLVWENALIWFFLLPSWHGSFYCLVGMGLVISSGQPSAQVESHTCCVPSHNASLLANPSPCEGWLERISTVQWVSPVSALRYLFPSYARHLKACQVPGPH